MRQRVVTVTEAVAAELRAEKGRKRISQTALADVIGRGQSYVSDRLNGKAPLTIDEFVKLSLALGCRPADLLEAALAAFHGVIYGPDGEAEYIQMVHDDGTPHPPPKRRPPTLTQADVAPAAEDRDGTDEHDYDSA